MNEEELYEVLSSFKQAIEMLNEKVTEQDEKLDDLENIIFDNILDPVKKTIEENNYKNFSDKYSEKLSPYADKMKALEGDDFDIVKETYNGLNDYRNSEDAEYSDDEYVDEVINQVENVIKEVKASFGIPEDEPITIEENPEDGSIEVSTEDGSVEKEIPEEDEAFDEEALEKELAQYKRK